MLLRLGCSRALTRQHPLTAIPITTKHVTTTAAVRAHAVAASCLGLAPMAMRTASRWLGVCRRRTGAKLPLGASWLSFMGGRVSLLPHDAPGERFGAAHVRLVGSAAVGAQSRRPHAALSLGRCAHEGHAVRDRLSLPAVEEAKPAAAPRQALTRAPWCAEWCSPIRRERRLAHERGRTICSPAAPRHLKAPGDAPD